MCRWIITFPPPHHLAFIYYASNRLDNLIESDELKDWIKFHCLPWHDFYVWMPSLTLTLQSELGVFWCTDSSMVAI